MMFKRILTLALLMSFAAVSAMDQGDIAERMRTATKENQIATVQNLLRAGANPTYGGRHMPYLFYALGNKRMFEVLLAAGADINFIHNGDTVLDLAEPMTRDGYLPKDTVTFLRSKGAKKASEL